MKKPDFPNIEVDMVPLIDIISLLLMFLIIVGDTTATSNSIKMKLPVADQAKHDWGEQSGRIVIQLKPADAGDTSGKYCAVFNGSRHSDTEISGGSLKEHLQRYLNDELKHGRANWVQPENTIDIPVKLRIPSDCPMAEAEKVMYTLSEVKLVNVQYAAAARK